MRGVTCSAPNCTVSPMAASKAMMRPVILSSPENSAPLLVIFCDGGSGMTSSPGCGEVSAGCGVPRGCRWPGARGSTAAVAPSGGGKLNGVYGLSRVTQGLSERAASALKGLWPSGAWWQRPRTKAKRAGSTQQSILASAVVVPRNIVHAAVANNQCPASTTRGRKSPQGKTG